MLLPPLETAGRFAAPARERWLELVNADLKGAPFERRLITRTYEGVDIQLLYSRGGVPPSGDPAGFSGLIAITRAARALGNTRAGWDLRQERAEADLRDA